MGQIWDIILLVLRTFPMMITDVGYLLIIGLVFFLVYRQYQKVYLYERKMFGLVRIKPFVETTTAMIYGLIGGLIATTLFVMLGVSLSDSGIAYLWIAALILMLIHPRFLCFSYAGGLISLASILFGYPKVDVPALMALVAILHLVEAFLIAIDGYHNASPIYVKHGQEIVGGFTLQKFWPLPFVALLGMVVMTSGIDFESLAMPDWWPIFSSGTAVPSDYSMVYMLFPVIAALGYSDVAVTSLPRTKARHSAAFLTMFSVILLGLALLANRIPQTAILAALFSPLGHEFVIYLGRRMEKVNRPVFTCNDGVMVLAVQPDSPAERMGLAAGDVIRSVNGRQVSDLAGLLSEITPWAVDPVLEVDNPLKADASRIIKYKGKIPPLGVIPTPHPRQGFYVKMDRSPLQTLLRKLRLFKGK